MSQKSDTMENIMEEIMGDTVEKITHDALPQSSSSAFIPPTLEVSKSINDKPNTVIEMEQHNKVGNLQTSVHRMETKVDNLHGRVEGIESNIAGVTQTTEETKTISSTPIKSLASLVEFM